MDLAAYLDRIGFQGVARPDRATLDAVHRLHLLSIPYENLNVQLRRPLTIDPQAAFEKLVTQRRGGWCYEMNGLLGLALEHIGFDVMRMAGGVLRSAAGEINVGNHLVLRVALPEGPVIADVGFGDGPILPFDLKPGPFTSGVFDFSLEAVEGGWWRLRNSPYGGAPDFDFREVPADEALLSEKCAFLQTAEVSPFVQNLVCQIQRQDGVTMLRGRVLRHVRPGVTDERMLTSAADLMTVLREEFALDVPEAADLWDAIVRRHDEVFGGVA
jgi:N-hydroxyarylamine O-acetyltransferase